MFKKSKLVTFIAAFVMFATGTQVAHASATINGGIYDNDGTTITGLACTIGLWSAPLGTITSEIATTTTSEIDGTFSLTAPTEGEYALYSDPTGDCVGMPQYWSQTLYVVDGETRTEPLHRDIPSRRATLRGRILNYAGAPVAEEAINHYSINADASVDTWSTTTSAGRFNTSLAAGQYFLSMNASNYYGAGCSDTDNPLGVNETCLSWLRRDLDLEANDLLDLGDISFSIGEEVGVVLLFQEEVSPGVFNPIAVDEIAALSYENTTDNLAESGSVTLSDDGLSANVSLDSDVEWVVNVVAKDGRKVYHGSLVIGPEQTGSEVIEWGDVEGLPEISINSPAVDLVLTEKFDLDDPSLGTLNQSFDATQAQSFTLTNGVQIDIPAYATALSGTSTILVEPAFDIEESYFPVDGLSYNMTVFDSNNTTVSSFMRPISITMPYTDSDLTLFDVDESNLAAWYYDESDNRWKVVSQKNYSVDQVNNEITLNVTHFSQYGVMVDQYQDVDDKVSENNGEAKLRTSPMRVKNVKAPKKLRTLTSEQLTNIGELRTRIALKFKKQKNANMNMYQARFSTKNGQQLKKGRYKTKTYSPNAADRSASANNKLGKLTVGRALIPGRKYYLQVRRYQEHGDIKVYSPWSKKTTVVVKKKDFPELMQ